MNANRRRIVALLPQRSTYAAGSRMLHVAVAGAPAQQVLRPSDLDDPALQSAMEQEALFGQRPVFDRGQGVQASVSRTTLVIRQPNAEITVDERGSVRVSRPARDAGGWPGAGSLRSSRRTQATASRAPSATPGGCWTASTRPTG